MISIRETLMSTVIAETIHVHTRASVIAAELRTVVIKLTVHGPSTVKTHVSVDSVIMFECF